MKSACVTTEQTLLVAAFHFLLVSFGAKDHQSYKLQFKENI